jgi:2-oxoglutarate ferredoxin oxidoreductase subunit alpha
VRAFSLAERFRCPVFVMLDKELALTLSTVEWGDEEVTPAPEPAGTPARSAGGEPFRPYCYDPPDATPPLVPFGGPQLVRFTGSSHDERGFLTKDPRAVGALNRHLVAKIEEHRDEIEQAHLDRQAGARTLLVSYGVTAGAMREATRLARAEGRSVSALTVQSLWPVPEQRLREALEGVNRVVVAELNLGDYRRELDLIVPEGIEVLGVNRVDGELITPEQIVRAIP